MKNILIASFYFPPYADVAGTRALKFCKFLPEYGWKPQILTVDKRYYGKKVIDVLPDEIQSISISRLPYLPLPAAKIFASIIYPFFILFFILMNKKQIDAVLIIGSPYHPFILTTILTTLFNLPTALDFRDAWSYNFGFDGKQGKKQHLLAKIKSRIFLEIEKISLKYATFATFATSVLRDEYMQLIPQYKKKYHVIYNGYDQDDFSDITPISISEGRTIILTGKFHIYTPQAVKQFLEVIRDIPDLTFIYVGGEYNIIKSIAQEVNADQKLIAIKYQPYEHVLQLIAGSTYCLLSNGLVNGMGTKIFDYIALGKPTFCLVPKGSIIAAQFKNNPGIIISEEPHTKAKIEDSLRSLFSQDSTCSKSLDDKFSRRNAAKTLASLLNNVVSSG